MLPHRKDSGSESEIKEMDICFGQNKNDLCFRKGLMPVWVQRRELAGAPWMLRREMCGFRLRHPGAGTRLVGLLRGHGWERIILFPILQNEKEKRKKKKYCYASGY